MEFAAVAQLAHCPVRILDRVFGSALPRSLGHHYLSKRFVTPGHPVQQVAHLGRAFPPMLPGIVVKQGYHCVEMALSVPHEREHFVHWPPGTSGSFRQSSNGLNPTSKMALNPSGRTTSLKKSALLCMSQLKTS